MGILVVVLGCCVGVGGLLLWGECWNRCLKYLVCGVCCGWFGGWGCCLCWGCGLFVCVDVNG